MHSAPAVSYPVGRSFFHALLLVGVLAVGAGSLVTWAVQSDAISLRHVVMAGLWLISVVVSVRAWFHSPAGLLTWDGQHWTWQCSDEGRVVGLRVIMDSQNTLLLQLHTPDTPAVWVWLERRTSPIRWLPLRRAVFAPQSATQATDAGWAAP